MNSSRPAVFPTQSPRTGGVPGLRACSSKETLEVENQDQSPLLNDGAKKPKQRETSWIWKAMDSELVKLAISTAIIGLSRAAGAFLRQNLLLSGSLIDGTDPFPAYSELLRLADSALTALFMLAIILIRKVKFSGTAPASVYVAIASMSSLAAVSKREVTAGVGRLTFSSFSSLLIFAVMIFLIHVARSKFTLFHWGVAASFVAACQCNALSELLTASDSPTSSPPSSPISLWSSLRVVFFALSFLGGESLSLSLQDLLFLHHRTSVVEQLFLVHLLVALINLLGLLLGEHLGRVVGFMLDHPQALPLLILSSLPVSFAFFSMSFMLQLCGALTCVIISRMLSLFVLLIAESAHTLLLVTAFRIAGLALMSACLAALMSNMSYRNGPNSDSGAHALAQSQPGVSVEESSSLLQMSARVMVSGPEEESEGQEQDGLGKGDMESGIGEHIER